MNSEISLVLGSAGKNQASTGKLLSSKNHCSEKPLNSRFNKEGRKSKRTNTETWKKENLTPPSTYILY